MPSADRRPHARSAAACASLALLLAWLPRPLFAAELRGGKLFVVEAGEVIDDDVVAGAERIRIDGTITGDLVAAAEEIVVDGRVGGDLIAAAETLVVNGEIGDDVRIAGYAVVLAEEADVVDDVFAAGFSVEKRPGSNVGGSVHVAAYQALLDGRVSEDVLAAASALELRAEVGGSFLADVGAEPRPGFLSFLFDPSVDVPELEPGLTVTESAVVRGDLRYRSPREARIDADARVEGTTQFARDEQPRERGRGGPGLRPHLRRWITIAAVGLLLLWLAPGWLERITAVLRRDPLPSLGWGAAVALAVALAASGIAVTTAILVLIAGGLTLGGLAPPFVGVGLLLELALLTPFLIAAVYVPPVLASLVGGRLALERWRPGWLERRWVPLLVGALLYVVVVAVPLVGAVLWLGVTLLGLGALAIQIRESLGGEAPATG